MIRVVLPAHLRTLARVGSELALEVDAEPTLASVMDALESRYPMLMGTLRDHVTRQRRPYVRFFACARDLSHDSTDAPLPDGLKQGWMNSINIVMGYFSAIQPLTEMIYTSIFERFTTLKFVHAGVD